MYRIFDSISYGHMEPLVPFTLLETVDNLNSALEYIKNLDGIYFIIDSDNRIINI
jgi:hypothetical protein